MLLVFAPTFIFVHFANVNLGERSSEFIYKKFQNSWFKYVLLFLEICLEIFFLILYCSFLYLGIMNTSWV